MSAITIVCQQSYNREQSMVVVTEDGRVNHGGTTSRNCCHCCTPQTTEVDEHSLQQRLLSEYPQRRLGSKLLGVRVGSCAHWKPVDFQIPFNKKCISTWRHLTRIPMSNYSPKFDSLLVSMVDHGGQKWYQSKCWPQIFIRLLYTL